MNKLEEVLKKILIVYDRMMTGGTTTALISMLNEFDYNKYDVDLLLFDGNGEFNYLIPEKVKVLEYAQISSRHLKLKKLLVSILNGDCFRIFKSYIKYKNTHKGNLRNIIYHYFSKNQVQLSRKITDKYDVAIGYIEGWSNHFVLSSKVNADKIIIWVHPDYKASYLIPEVDKKAFDKATNIVLVSKKCLESLCTCLPEYSHKAICIENVISYNYIRKRAEETNIEIRKDKLNVCTVCRCDIYVKGLDRMVNVLKMLNKEKYLENMHWHLIGDGPELPRLKKQAEEANLSENITFYGQKNNPLPYLAQMDLFVLPSRYEGKPVSVDEAKALNIPCLVTEYVSAREQVTDQIEGIVVENSEQGLYEGIKAVINDNTILAQMKKNLSERKKNKFSEMMKLYEILGE